MHMANTKPGRVNAMFMLRWLLVTTARLLSPLGLIGGARGATQLHGHAAFARSRRHWRGQSAPSTCAAVGVSLDRISG